MPTEDYKNIYAKAAKMSNDQLLENMTEYYDANDYEGFWVMATIAVNKAKKDYEFMDEVKDSIDSMFSEMGTAENNGKMPIYLDALAYFLTNQNALLKGEVIKLMNTRENLLYFHAINQEKTEHLELFDIYRSNNDMSKISSITYKWMAAHHKEALNKTIDASSNITYNNGELLRGFLINKMYDFEFIHGLITKHGFDINDVGSFPGNNINLNWSFAQHACMISGADGWKFFNEFIDTYADKINFDVLYNKSIPLLSIIAGTKDLTRLEKLDRLDVIVQKCNLTEKHISQVVNSVIASDTIAEFYDHSIYTNLFKNPSFNSSLFDRSIVLINILKCDVSDSVRKVVKNGHGVNPTVMVLNAFYAHANQDIKFQQHPFISWCHLSWADHLQSRDTLGYLFNHYEKDIKSWDANFCSSLHPLTREKLAIKNFNIPKKPGFFSKLLNGKPDLETVEKPQLEEAVRPVVETVAFNEILFARVLDSNIQQYIASIKLNAEQFDVLVSGGHSIENEHYMKKLLPTFLNKTIENYLHFSTVNDGDEAKENVVLQLKLLNKKTFEVLSDSLEQETESMKHKQKVHNKVLRSY